MKKSTSNKRRDFIKTLGIGSGVFLMDPVNAVSKNKQESHNNMVDLKVFRKVIYKTDVLIAGGGMSGICAAIAAARNGCKVILVQNRSRLGGNASSEIRMHISGASALNQVWRETGILEELVLTESVENPQRSYEIWDAVLFDKLVSEKNITLLLDTTVMDVEVTDNKVTMVRTICSPTEEIYEISAKFYADCTGDGTLGALSGAEFMQGREAKSTWGESLAVDKADLRSMGNSLLFMSQKHAKKMPYNPPQWARKYTNKDFVHREIYSLEYGYWWLELGGMEDAVKDGQKNRKDLLSALFGVWDYIKNSGNYPEADNWALSWVGMIPGKRESRRLTGDYIMHQKDIQSPSLFPDRVAYGGWPLDDHPPGGMDTMGIVPLVSIALKGPYSIPFRSLYSKNIGNLLMAGRNISVSHVALSSTRVMATCAALGQAVGTGIAYCNTNGILPKEVGNQQSHFTKLQQMLLRQDQPILGIINEDENDLARMAEIKASSETPDGAAINIIDGYNRDIKDGNSHQWRADMKLAEPWIELKWNMRVKINQIQLVFDTGLHRFLRISPEDNVYSDQIRGPQPETISDYTIDAKIGSVSKRIVAVKNNYLRRVVNTFEPLEVDSIRITVQKTNGDPQAKLFEVRCYFEPTEKS